MKVVLITLVCLISTAIQNAAGLRCYECAWMKGNPAESDTDCEMGVSDRHLATCDDTRALSVKSPLLTLPGKPWSSGNTKSNATEDTKQAWKYACLKETGKYYGSDYIIRSCIEGPPSEVDRLVGTCERLPDDSGWTNINGCFCNKDKCNGSNSIKNTCSLVFGLAFVLLRSVN